MTIQILEQIIERHGKEIYFFCLRLTNKKETAEELYQDTWLYACKNLDKIDDDRNVRSYLLSVAIHHWQNQKRKYAWRKRIIPETEYREEADGEQVDIVEEGLSKYLNLERDQMVRNAIFKLKDKYQIPILLFYMQEMSIKEISSLLKIPVGTVKSRLNYARKYLEKELEDYIHE